MKAAISAAGVLTITPETPTESYALRRWNQEGENQLSTGVLHCDYEAPLTALHPPVSDQPTTAPSVRTGGLVKLVVDILVAEVPELRDPYTSTGLAQIVIREVADWLDRMGNKGSANDLRREIDR